MNLMKLASQSSAKLLIPLVFLLLSGCASNLPKTIDDAPVPDIQYGEVKNNPDQNTGKTVRWGGKIISVENTQQSSRIEILTMPLDSSGEPFQSEDYQGRFLADVNEFIDEEYYKNKTITVYGTIDSSITKAIGEHEYEYPLITASEYHVWPRRVPINRTRYYDPFWYPGFYGGFGRGPFLHPYYRFGLRSRFGFYGW